MAIAGLVFIILGWVIQLLSKDKTIKRSFILVYALGDALLVIDGFQNNLTTLAILNLVSFVAAIAVLYKNK